MSRAQLTVAAFAVAVVAVALDARATSAGAQPQSVSAGPTVWDHNGSVMYLVENGSRREFYYQKPRAGMLEVGVHPGSLLFRGEIENGQYSGTAYIFNVQCGQIPFQVTGRILDNDERIVLTGQAPRVGRNCRIHESSTSSLEFKRVKQKAPAQSQEQFTATTAPRVEEPNPGVPSTSGGQLPSAPPAAPSASPGTTSQSAALKIAGKGKYCKEAGVRGYLDCFYTSLEACQKHNKSASVRCVPNPNSGS
jgi:hypothetical protein